MFSLACPESLKCQVSFMESMMQSDGFVFNNGDTLTGRIILKQKFIENNPYEIKFTGINGESKIYDASRIEGFGIYSIPVKNDFDDLLYYDLADYESRPSQKKDIPVFMNRLLDGRIKVFMNRSSSSVSTTTVKEKSKIDGIAFSFSPREGLIIGPSYKTSYQIIEGRTRYTSYFVEKSGETLIKVNKVNYGECFQSLFGDCPSIEEELTKNPDLRSFKNFMILAEVYNQLCN